MRVVVGRTHVESKSLRRCTCQWYDFETSHRHDFPPIQRQSVSHLSYSSCSSMAVTWLIQIAERPKFRGAVVISTNEWATARHRTPIRQTCEVFNSSFTGDQSNNMIEGIQKRALRIIFGYSNTFSELLAVSGLHRLSVRREELCHRLFYNTLIQDTQLSSSSSPA